MNANCYLLVVCFILSMISVVILFFYLTALEAEFTGNQVVSKSYEALQRQIWSLLPGFCNNPIDLTQVRTPRVTPPTYQFLLSSLTTPNSTFSHHSTNPTPPPTPNTIPPTHLQSPLHQTLYCLTFYFRIASLEINL